MADAVLLTTECKDLKFFRRGKVRDIYDLGDTLLIISSDRISCFDVVLPDGIPHKGYVLTALSKFWFSLMEGIIPHHLISTDVKDFPPAARQYLHQLEGRSMLVKKSKPLPVECIVRGYLSGSGWKEYQQTQSICGIKLPAGLKESDRLPEPIFTPSTKADVGHDMNVSQEHVAGMIGSGVTGELREKSIAIYKKASEYARTKGIIIADTKFEFGLQDGKLMLIDEVLTPDSSRFWPLDQYKPGAAQPSFDKQFVRDYLESISWDKNPPAPRLPADIIGKTSQKYLNALKVLSGQ
ncbi:MAG: phosphoribosylaminoimidazolesuccinocarboxamide synthase [Candidatus Omnitrophota bacterium]